MKDGLDSGGVQINDWSQVLVSVLRVTGIQWWEVGRYVKIKYVPNDEVLEF